MMNGDGPVVAGYVPVELVVIVEKLGGVADGVLNVDRPGGIGGAGHKDFELKKSAGGFFLILQRRAGVVSDRAEFDKQRIVGAAGPRIVHGNVAVNAVILAGEDKGDLLADSRRAVFIHMNGAVVLGNIIAARPRRRAETDQK